MQWVFSVMSVNIDIVELDYAVITGQHLIRDTNPGLVPNIWQGSYYISTVVLSTGNVMSYYSLPEYKCTITITILLISYHLSDVESQRCMS